MRSGAFEGRRSGRGRELRRGVLPRCNYHVVGRAERKRERGRKREDAKKTSEEKRQSFSGRF